MRQAAGKRKRRPTGRHSGIGDAWDDPSESKQGRRRLRHLRDGCSGEHRREGWCACRRRTARRRTPGRFLAPGYNNRRCCKAWRWQQHQKGRREAGRVRKAAECAMIATGRLRPIRCVVGGGQARTKANLSTQRDVEGRLLRGRHGSQRHQQAGDKPQQHHCRDRAAQLPPDASHVARGAQSMIEAPRRQTVPPIRSQRSGGTPSTNRSQTRLAAT